MNNNPEKVLLTIIVPAYNEEDFVETLLRRVLRVELPSGCDSEIIIVDDGSTDDTSRIVADLQTVYPERITVLRNEVRRGKGFSVRRALEHARGTFTIIQDADLEYSPDEYGELLAPLLDGSADAVYGSRFASRHRRRVLYYWHSLGNHFLTRLVNMSVDLNLTDMESCYKAARTSLLKSIPLSSNDFRIEPEITIKLAKRRARIFEVPISYEGRSYAEGKKIRVKDGFLALLAIVRYSLSSSLYKDNGEEILDAFSMAPYFNRWMADTLRP